MNEQRSDEMEQQVSSNSTLPFEGEWKLASDCKYAETILMVPFFGGTKQSLKRHCDFLNSLGYNCVVFNLKCEINNLADLPISSEFVFGLKSVWADQIEKMLNSIPGRKIVFSFSNPSAGAIEAIGRRSASDIAGLICDGGPSAEPFISIYNYFKKEKPQQLLPVRLLLTALSTLSVGPKFVEDIHIDLKQLPNQFRILSIRGWKDPLITPVQIDKIFEPHLQIDWRKLSLPEGDHLNGLKDFFEEYSTQVQKFLTEISMPSSDVKK